MSDLDLDTLERLAAAATPGPWRIEVAQPRYDIVSDAPGLATQSDRLICQINDYNPNGNGEPHAAFIAAARSAVPALVAEVRALRGEPVKGVPTEEGWYLAEVDGLRLIVEIGCHPLTGETCVELPAHHSHLWTYPRDKWRWLRRLDLDALAGGGR